MLPVALNAAVASAPLVLLISPAMVRSPPSASAVRSPLISDVPIVSESASLRLTVPPETMDTAPVKSLDALSMVTLLPAPAVTPVVPITVNAPV